MLGFKLHQHELMDSNAFKCINCNSETIEEEVASAKLEAEEILSDLRRRYIGYDGYGDYVYYFDDRGFNFNNDNDWKYTNQYTTEKCTLSIPGLDHKLCVSQDENNNYNIRFDSSSHTEIDNSYYDLYGYDEYYYMNNDENDDYYGMDYDYNYDNEYNQGMPI